MSEKYYPIELLHWSGMNDENIDKVKIILDTHPEYINTLNSLHDNALIIACRMGNLEIAKYLVENTNIDIQHATKEGNALTVAVEKKHKEIIDYLVLNSDIEIERRIQEIELIKELKIKRTYRDLNKNLEGKKKIKNNSKI